MKYSINNHHLTFFFEGRVDSTNATAIEEEVFEAIVQNAHDGIVVDARDLVYISSAGLRIFLKMLKREKGLRIVNVPAPIFEVFEMTGFTEMMTVEKAYREFSVDGCEVLGTGANGIVYRYDPELVIKVYRNEDALDDIRRERELARKALILGIPTAIPFDVVRVGEKYASVFELLNSKSFSKLIRDNPDKMNFYVDLFVDLLKQIHSTAVRPTDMPSMKEVAIGWAHYLKDYLPERQGKKLCMLMESVPERYTMIHGDYHTNNVQMQNGEILLVDMDTLSYGHPIFEFASMYLADVAFGELDPDVILRYMGLPMDMTRKIFEISMRKYLNTEDTERVNSVIEKAQVIAYTRLMRRTIRRNANTEFGQKQIELCKDKLMDLLWSVDSLDF